MRLWRIQRNVDADVDALPEARQADLGQYLLRNGDDGAAVVDRLDGGSLDTFLDQSPSTRAALTRVDSGNNGFDAARFIRNTDPEDRAVLDRLDGPTQTRLYLRYGEGDIDASNLRRIDELIESGDMDQADVQRLLGILETRDTDPLIDEAVEAEDLTEIGSRGDLSSTQLVVNDDSGNTRWLEQGTYDPDASTDNTGWAYLQARHIDGAELESKPATNFWPVGQKVRDEELPDTMTETDVRRSIYEALENSETTDQDAIVYDGFSSSYVDRTGVEAVRVIIRNGRIRTAFPKRGPSVWKYVSEGDVGWIK